MLVVGAVAHHVLDAGAVVPGPVEQDYLACEPAGVQRIAGNTTATVRDPTAVAAPPPSRPGVEILRDPADGAPLAGAVPSLEDHRDPGSAGADPFL